MGNLVIIAAFGKASDTQGDPHVSRLVFVDASNRAKEFKHRIAVQSLEA